MSASIRPSAVLGRIVFGMVPQRDDDKTRILLNDLCALLSKSAGVPVQPHRAPSAEALAHALRGGRVQVAWTGALLLLLNEHMNGIVPILSSVREGVALYHSAIFAPEASSIRTIEQLKGRSIAWVAPSSASGYVVPRVSLVRRGVDVRGLFREELFVGSHTATARAVFEGKADVGATYVVFENGDPTKKIVRSGFLMADRSRAVHLLDVSGPVPGDLIVASPTVPVVLREAIAAALEVMAPDPAHKGIMHDLIGADGFVRYNSSVLGEMRELIQNARAAGALGAEPPAT